MLTFGTLSMIRDCPAMFGRNLNDPSNDVAVSIVSLWEVGIKTGLGKWPLTINVLGLEALAASQSIDIIPISVEAIHYTASMDWFNRDPFDRLISASAILRGDVLVSTKSDFERWGVKRFW